jgi:hypothetical protein
MDPGGEQTAAADKALLRSIVRSVREHEAS